MRDVAEAADVSTATVSRVLSGSDDSVRPETASLVREVASRLGYRYNAVAASLRLQQTKTLGVIVPRIANPFFSVLTEHIERRLAESETALIIADSQEDPRIEEARVSALIDRRVDGLILIPTAGVESAALAEASTVPTVLLDLLDAGPSVDTVGVEHDHGIEEVVHHLHERGHRRIAFVGGETARSPSAGRLSGYRRSVPDEDQAAILLGEFNMDWGFAAGSRLDLATTGATAAVCANDLVAYGLMQWAHGEGLDIPGDLAISGFDDLPFSSVTAPPLTTVAQPVEELAEETLDLLSARVEDPTRPHREVRLRGNLVVRDTT